MNQAMTEIDWASVEVETAPAGTYRRPYKLRAPLVPATLGTDFLMAFTIASRDERHIPAGATWDFPDIAAGAINVGIDESVDHEQLRAYLDEVVSTAARSADELERRIADADRQRREARESAERTAEELRRRFRDA
jgi:hypothetical protein